MIDVPFRQQQRIASDIVDDGLQVQPGAHVNGRHLIAMRLNGSGKLADPLLIGTRRLANKELFTDQQHVAAIHMTPLAHVHQWTKTGKHRRYRCHFPLATRRAGMSDDRQFRHDDRGIFNKVGIRIIRGRRQYGHFQAELQQGFDIGEELTRGAGNIRRAEPGGGLTGGTGCGRQAGDSLVKMHREPSGD